MKEYFDSINKHNLIICITISYLIPILIVCYLYNNSPNISYIISKNKIKYIILFFMIVFGIFVILYEKKNNDYFSLSIILVLLFSIYGSILTYYKSNIHNFFASISFIAVFIFMLFNTYKYNNTFLYILFTIQLLLSILQIIVIPSLYSNNYLFFHIEFLYILIFAIFYFYLYYIRNKKFI